MMRRIIPVENGSLTISLELDGVRVQAIPGESLAGMMFARGVGIFRWTSGGKPRAPYCAMGTCFECRVEVRRIGQEPVVARACMTPVEDGMVVNTVAPREKL